MRDKIHELEQAYLRLTNEQIDSSQDKVTERNKWMPSKLKRLNNKALKKPEYVLVQHLRNNHTMDFQICKIVSGNIVVIDNKGHKLNPKFVWRHGKFMWYILGEWDTEPIGPRYLERIRDMQRSTDNHPILMKMVLGAVQKKEEIKANKNMIIWIIVIAVVGIGLFMVFGK
jgi:hypothetical protein